MMRQNKFSHLLSIAMQRQSTKLRGVAFVLEQRKMHRTRIGSPHNVFDRCGSPTRWIKNMMKTLVLTAALCALLSGPASAQIVETVLISAVAGLSRDAAQCLGARRVSRPL